MAQVPTFLTCEKAGHADKNMGFSMIAEDGQRHDFAITPECFLQMFAMGWNAAEGLGPRRTGGQTPNLSGEAAFAILNMQPALALFSGPLTLAVPISEPLLSALQDGMKTLGRPAPGHEH